MSASSPSVSRPGLLREIRTSLVLAAPLVAGHVSTGLIGFVDNTLAGHHSTTTLASVTIGTALWWLPMMVPIGTLLSVPPSVSQLEGAGRRGEIGALFRQALWMALLLSVFLFAFLTLIPHALPAMGIAPGIVPGAREFLHGIRWGVPALTLFFCMRYLSEGLHWTLPTMLLSAGGLLILLPLGYVLTFGKFGLPEMGAGGLGIASAAMLWVQAIGFFFVLRNAKRFADLRLFERFDKPHWPTIRGLLATGLPIGVTVLMEGSLFIVTALLIGRLGEVPASAHQIAINLSALCFMVPMGLAEATTVRVGHALGRRDYAGVRRAGFAGYAIVLCTQLLSGILLLSANDVLVGFYTTDMAVASLAASLLLYSAMFQFPDGIQVLSAGALRGLKDTRVPMILAALAYWGVGMPIGAGLGLGLGWGPKGMWIGLIAGLTVAAVLLCARFLRSSQPERLAERMAREAPHEVDPHETGCT
ncbi:MATE family multidrug resistance protein [Lysobacter enzymogenes]|jgi:MATE family multidrug resistance protein|uniref:MATE family efflux transporter n=1 Tax=Lysobacter enzymogenes TaxID=69 RepID=UPI0008987327|nr:MATE family efflux transporter [Lysobacter enzymogenes]SDX71378.1 multidrug resistance protein, MATE family [Lysobacter enzymogenes]